jgi:hypothetical protein
MLCDKKLELFERYKCMFSLRNRGGQDCVTELGTALVKDNSSALLRHEVAYVLGQMQHPSSVEALEASLRREGEHAMVRHEAAEALGAIQGRWDDCEKILMEFMNDPDDVVKESCQVALDAADYFGVNVSGNSESGEPSQNDSNAGVDGESSGANSDQEHSSESPKVVCGSDPTAEVDAPKRAKSAYLYYCDGIRPVLQEEHPGRVAEHAVE